LFAVLGITVEGVSCPQSGGLKLDYSQHVLEKHHKEKYRRDGAEQQAHEIAFAFFVPEADSMERDISGDGQENDVYEGLCLADELKHGRTLTAHSVAYNTIG
jgi:hypothetical protein